MRRQGAHGRLEVIEDRGMEHLATVGHIAAQLGLEQHLVIPVQLIRVGGGFAAGEASVGPYEGTS